MNYPLRTLKAHLIRHSFETSDEPDEQGRWIFRDEDGEIHMWSSTKERSVFHHVETTAEAHGVSFLCPLCFEKNNGPVGTHSLHIYFVGSPVPEILGKNRWTLDLASTNLDDLILTPSILIVGGCAWHGFIGSSGVPAGHAG